MAEATFQHVRVEKKFERACGLRTVRSRIATCSTAVAPPKPVRVASKIYVGAFRARRRSPRKRCESSAGK